MKQKKRLIIIILNYNSSKEAFELFNLIESFKLLFVDCFIIDNNSENKDLNFLKENISSEKIIFNKTNLGYGSGNNIGLKKAVNENYEYVLILNPDIRLNKNTIIELLKQLDLDSELLAIGPRICYREYPNIIYSDGGLVNLSRGFRASHLNYKKSIQDIIHSNKQIDYINGSCLMIRTRLLKYTGLFLDDFFLYYEETEWCMRVRQMGYKIAINTKSIAYHSISKKKSIYHFYMTRNRLLIARRFDVYFTRTAIIVLKDLLKELKKVILDKNYKSPFLIDKFKGLSSGVFSKIEKYEGLLTFSEE